METPMQETPKVLDRRGFLAGIIAACAAPAIVRSGLIMPIKPALVVPEYTWKSLSTGITTSEQQFVGYFHEIFGQDTFGNQISERVPANPDIVAVSRKNFKIIEKIVLRASAYIPPGSHQTQAAHGIHQTENQNESVETCPRSQQT